MNLQKWDFFLTLLDPGKSLNDEWEERMAMVSVEKVDKDHGGEWALAHVEPQQSW